MPYQPGDRVFAKRDLATAGGVIVAGTPGTVQSPASPVPGMVSVLFDTEVSSVLVQEGDLLPQMPVAAPPGEGGGTRGGGGARVLLKKKKKAAKKAKAKPAMAKKKSGKKAAKKAGKKKKRGRG